MQNEYLKGGKYYHIYNRGNNRMNLFSAPADYERFLGLYDKYISPVADTLAWVLMPNYIHLLVRIKENPEYKYSLSLPISNKLVNAVGWEKWFEEHKWETKDLLVQDLSAYEVPDNVVWETNKFDQHHDNFNQGEPFKRRQVCDADGLAGSDLPGFAESDNIGNGNIHLSNADRSVDAVGLQTCQRSQYLTTSESTLKKPIPSRHFSHLFNAYTRYYHNRNGGCGNLFERPFKRKQIENESYLKQVVLYIHNNPVHHGFCTHPLEYAWSSYLSCVSKKPTKLKRGAVTNLFWNIDNFKTEHSKKIDIELIEKWLNVDIDFVTNINDLSPCDLSAFAEPDNVEKDKIPDNVEVKRGSESELFDNVTKGINSPNNDEFKIKHQL